MNAGFYSDQFQNFSHITQQKAYSLLTDILTCQVSMNAALGEEAQTQSIF